MGSLPEDTLCAYCFDVRAGYIPDGCVGPLCDECGDKLMAGRTEEVYTRRRAVLAGRYRKLCHVDPGRCSQAPGAASALTGLLFGGTPQLAQLVMAFLVKCEEVYDIPSPTPVGPLPPDPVHTGAHARSRSPPRGWVYAATGGQVRLFDAWGAPLAEPILDPPHSELGRVMHVNIGDYLVTSSSARTRCRGYSSPPSQPGVLLGSLEPGVGFGPVEAYSRYRGFLSVLTDGWWINVARGNRHFARVLHAWPADTAVVASGDRGLSLTHSWWTAAQEGRPQQPEGRGAVEALVGSRRFESQGSGRPFHAELADEVLRAASTAELEAELSRRRGAALDRARMRRQMEAAEARLEVQDRQRRAEERRVRQERAAVDALREHGYWLRAAWQRGYRAGADGETADTVVGDDEVRAAWRRGYSAGAEDVAVEFVADSDEVDDDGESSTEPRERPRAGPGTAAGSAQRAPHGRTRPAIGAPAIGAPPAQRAPHRAPRRAQARVQANPDRSGASSASAGGAGGSSLRRVEVRASRSDLEIMRSSAPESRRRRH